MTKNFLLESEKRLARANTVRERKKLFGKFEFKLCGVNKKRKEERPTNKKSSETVQRIRIEYTQNLDLEWTMNGLGKTIKKKNSINKSKKKQLKISVKLSHVIKITTPI